MTLDIRGALKNTRRSKSLHVVFEELLSNAIDSYLIRGAGTAPADALRVEFLLDFKRQDEDEECNDLRLVCLDNGAGFGRSETKAFVTKDTSFKDDLTIPGIGHCKGTGRVQFFHFFKKLSINSRFLENGEIFERTVFLDESDKELDESDFRVSQVSGGDLSTRVILEGIRAHVFEQLSSSANLEDDLSPAKLKQHLLVTFLHRLVGIKEYIGEFSIKISASSDSAEFPVQEINLSDLPEAASSPTVEIPYNIPNSSALPKTEVFQITHYKIDKAEYDLPSNIIALSAKSSPVEIITRRYLKINEIENRAIDGCYHLLFVEAEYLDRHVNDQRDGFDIVEGSDGSGFLWDDELTKEEIYSALDPEIEKLITPPSWKKESIIESVSEKYGISQTMIADTGVRIRFGDTDEAVTKRVLAKYQERIVQDTSAIFELKQKIAELSPDGPEFREQINELAWKYTASIKSIDMSNLSQLVVRRAAVIEILQLAITKRLVVQQNVEGKRKDERLIHSIFFPMGKDTDETDEHDIWLLSEEYQYFEYISSDKALSSMELSVGDPLFESDVDEKLAQIFAQNSSNNERKRPDIAIFSQEGSVIIVEFKAPGVSLDDHVNDLMEYAQLLAAKSKGRLRKFYGYLIGDTVNPNRLRGYERFPNGHGYFSTEPLIEHQTREPLGELYSEILYYGDIVEKAEKRLQVYKDRLNVDL